MLQEPSTHPLDDLCFTVMEGSPAQTHAYSMTWRPERHFRKQEHAERYAAAMNAREEMLRSLAYAWYARAGEVKRNQSETRCDQALENAYSEFLEERFLDGAMKRSLTRLLENKMRSNSYLVMPRADAERTEDLVLGSGGPE